MAFSGTPQGRVFGWAGRLIQYVKRQMTRTASLVALALLLGNPVLAATPQPKGANCSLAAPPSGADEEFNHGVTLRVFPRVRDIHDSYNGCQNLWAPNGAGWEIISITKCWPVTRFASGHLMHPKQLWHAVTKTVRSLSATLKRVQWQSTCWSVRGRQAASRR